MPKLHVQNKLLVCSIGCLSSHVLLDLLNELGKIDKIQGLQSILSLFRNTFNRFNYTRALMLVHKYNILERVVVENIPRNMIINRGAAEVDNNNQGMIFSTSTLSRMVYLFYNTEQYCFIFLPWYGKFRRQRSLRTNEIIYFTKGLCL